MSSRCPEPGRAGLRLVAALGAALLAAPAAAGALRVCADPNNLPFSNTAREGFENKIAELLAADLGAALEYTWWAQRRGFVRNTIRAGACDVLLNVPAGFDPVATTRPYYRSSYVFVARQGATLPKSLEDPVLRDLRIGVQMIGNDFSNSPPAHALTARGIVDNVRGYMVYGDYATANPAADILRAVADREVDVAIVWGPLAGYFAGRESVPLALAPVTPERDAGLPMAFSMAMGVRKGDTALRDALDGFIARRGEDIGRILDAYGVPRLPPRAGGAP